MRLKRRRMGLRAGSISWQTIQAMYVSVEGTDGQCKQQTVTRFGSRLSSLGMSEAKTIPDHEALRRIERQLQFAVATQVPRHQPQAVELRYDSEFISL